MSNDNAWPHEMAARAKAVGWKAIKPRSLTGAYKVYMSTCGDVRCNHIMQIHLTSSDVNARRVVERDMNRHGLAKLEAKVAETKEKEKVKRIEADRAANEKRAAELAKQDHAIVRAAGPYAPPERVPNSWFTEDHPAPMTKRIILGPEQAKWMLDNLNSNNRPMRRATRDNYADTMLAGGWRETHQGISIDTDRVLQDGQHRVAAVLKSGVEIVTKVSVGEDPDNFMYIDEGYNRTPGQLINRGGAEANADKQIAMVKLVTAFGWNDRARIRDRQVNAQVLDARQADVDAVRRSTFFGTRNSRVTKIAPAPLGAVHYMLHKIHGEGNPVVDAFFRGLLTHRKLDPAFALEEKDPRLKLYDRLVNARASRKRLSTFDQLCLLVITWNLVMEDKRPNEIRWNVNQPVPRIVEAGPGHIPSLLTGEVEEAAPALSVAA